MSDFQCRNVEFATKVQTHKRGGDWIVSERHQSQPNQIEPALIWSCSWRSIWRKTILRQQQCSKNSGWEVEFQEQQSEMCQERSDEPPWFKVGKVANYGHSGKALLRFSTASTFDITDWLEAGKARSKPVRVDGLGIFFSLDNQVDDDV